ncbi:tetratricopeptide repeat protein [Mastigocoleus testarum]|uniref:CHAT domain-containing protein n=1 Tax=Mastigocoleus testarum BC008 TaxID=371196 RepID=A0A0V7ZSX3_9CYAN|nr:tetratricopeptide repeat protein [Mastigocoleus testarum]KST67715.1 hypothetical protein BC008_43965 [Mastigocoleus testarum BC008]
MFTLLGFSLLVSEVAVGEVNSPQIQKLDRRAALPRDLKLAEAARLNQQASQLLEAGKYREGIPLAQKALAIRQKILGEHPEVAQSLNNLAVLYLYQGNYQEAEPLFKQALEIGKRLLGNQHPDVVQSLNNLATLYSYQGNYQEAEPLFKQAFEIRKRLLGNQHPEVAQSLNELATLYLYQGNYQEAEPLFKQALEIRKRLLGNQHPEVAQSLNNLAASYESQGRLKEAESLFKQALQIRKRLLGNQHPEVAQSLNSLANLYRSQGRLKEAEPLYKQALQIGKRLLGNQHPNVAQSLNNLAGLYLDQGRLKEAEPLYKQALQMYKDLLGNQHPHVAHSLNNLAVLYENQGRLKEAEPLHKQALQMYKRLLGNQHPDVATSLNNLAGLYLDQGRLKEAEPLYKQALQMRKRLLGNQHPLVAISLNNLAGLYLDQGRLKEAEPLYKQALQMHKRLLGNQHPLVATSLNNLAGLYKSQGRYKEAEPLYKQALQMRKRLLGNQHPLVAISLNSLAALNNAQENITKTLEFLTQGLKVEEQNLSINLSAGFERQKRDYTRTISGTTYATISLHLNSAPNNSQAANLALTTIFRRKGRILDVLTNNLQILRQRVNDKNSLKLIDELSDNYSQIANLIYNRPENISLEKYRQQVTDLEKKTKDLEDQLSRRSAEFANLSQEVKSQLVKLEDIQKLIPDDAALVEIVRYRPFNSKAKQQNQSFGKPHYAAYVLNSTGEPQAIDLGETEKIEKSLELFRNSLQDPNITPTEQVKQSARGVDKLVMEPIRKLLGNKRKILIAPDGALNLIPFEALVDENNRYLIENYSFTYLTSGRDLLRLQNESPSKQSPSKQQPVIMGDPLFHKQGETVAVKSNQPNNTRFIDLSKINFPPLIGTREEAKSIATMLEVKPFLGSQASENVIKELQNPKILHIATHGFFESSPKKPEHQDTYRDNPLLLSGLVLSGYKNRQGGGNEDGILTALETTALNLTGTKLVVLSACDTSLGQDQTGEGLYSFRRALVIAGSESQVMSLWKVDDTASKDLTIAYYEKVLGKQNYFTILK